MIYINDIYSLLSFILFKSMMFSSNIALSVKFFSKFFLIKKAKMSFCYYKKTPNKIK